MKFTVSSWIKLLFSTIKSYVDCMIADAVTNVSLTTNFLDKSLAHSMPSNVGNSCVVVAVDGYK